MLIKREGSHNAIFSEKNNEVFSKLIGLKLTNGNLAGVSKLLLVKRKNYCFLIAIMFQ